MSKNNNGTKHDKNDTEQMLDIRQLWHAGHQKIIQRNFKENRTSKLI